MGLLLLPLIPIIRRPKQRSILIALCALSVCVQATSVVYSYALEFYQNRRHGIIPDEYVWRPAESQLFCRFENIARHAAGRPNLDSIPPDVEAPQLYKTQVSEESVRRMHAVQFFPFKAHYNTNSRKLYFALLALWSMLLLGGVAAGVGWYRATRLAIVRNE